MAAEKRQQPTSDSLVLQNYDFCAIAGWKEPENSTLTELNQLAESTKKFLQDKSACYNMNYESRGRCIIISHTRFEYEVLEKGKIIVKEDKRMALKGNRMDAKKMAECFSKKLGFKDIEIHTDDIGPKEFYGDFEDKVYPVRKLANNLDFFTLSGVHRVLSEGNLRLTP